MMRACGFWLAVALTSSLFLGLGAVFAGLYAKKVVDTHHYKPTICLVTGSNIEKTTCSYTVCSGGRKSTSCHIEVYACYKVHWKVFSDCKTKLALFRFNIRPAVKQNQKKQKFRVTDTIHTLLQRIA